MQHWLALSCHVALSQQLLLLLSGPAPLGARIGKPEGRKMTEGGKHHKELKDGHRQLAPLGGWEPGRKKHAGRGGKASPHPESIGL